MTPFRTVQCQGTIYSRPGTRATNFKPGDFILTHGNSFFSHLVFFGQSFRFMGVNRKFAGWDHCAVIINENGDLVEALGTGVRQTNIAKYDGRDYALVSITADAEDRDQVVNFALSTLGQRYNWLEILSIAVSLFTGLKISFLFSGEQICSGLVAKAMERTWAIFDREATNITPADLAKYYQIPHP